MNLGVKPRSLSDLMQNTQDQTGFAYFPRLITPSCGQMMEKPPEEYQYRIKKRRRLYQNVLMAGWVVIMLGETTRYR